jgi:glycosyltransferase 2 family protein
LTQEIKVVQPRNSYVSRILRLSVSLIIMILIFRLININEFCLTLKNINPSLLFFSIILFFPAQLLAAYRWWFILISLAKPFHYVDIFRYIIVGQISALLLPSQFSNDIAKGLQSLRGQKNKELILLSIILDRLFLILIIAFSAFWGSFHSSILRQVPLLKWVALAIFITVLFILLLVLVGKPMIWRLFKFASNGSVLSRHRERIIDYLYPSPALRFTAITWSIFLAIILQLVNVIGSLILAKSMQINVVFLDWLAINSTATIAQFIPLTFGGIGIREGTFATLLALYGVPFGKSTAFSLFSFVLISFLLLVVWLYMVIKVK